MCGRQTENKNTGVRASNLGHGTLAVPCLGEGSTCPAAGARMCGEWDPSASYHLCSINYIVLVSEIFFFCCLYVSSCVGH